MYCVKIFHSLSQCCVLIVFLISISTVMAEIANFINLAKTAVKINAC